MSQKSVKFHVKSNDYFGTLATTLSLIEQNIEKNKFKKEYIYLLKKVIDDLLYLQANYIIVKRFLNNSKH